MKLRVFPSVAATALCLSAGVSAGSRDGTLDFYWIDSQGGGSTLLVSPGGESVLIDAGNPGGRDPGRIHQVATSVAGLQRIDHLIVTHFHVDHFGGAPELAQLIPIGTVHDNGLTDRDPDGRNDASWPLKSKAYREMKVGGRSVVQPGEHWTLRPAPGTGSVAPGLTVVAARKKPVVDPRSDRTPPCQDPNPREPDSSDNANSIVTLIQFGPFRYFNGGDLTWNVEASLACPLAQTGSVDVYQVNHHGLDLSNNPLLLNQLSPTVAVFNNGPRKGCMPEVVKNLRALNSLQAIYQVHRNQQNPEVNAPAEQCANGNETGGNWIKLSVAPDGRTYTVTVPSTGHSRTYTTRY